MVSKTCRIVNTISAVPLVLTIWIMEGLFWYMCIGSALAFICGYEIFPQASGIESIKEVLSLGMLILMLGWPLYIIPVAVFVFTMVLIFQAGN